MDMQHRFKVSDKDSENPVSGSENKGGWWGFKDQQGDEKFEMKAGQSLTVELEMNWLPNHTKDVSVVAWSSSNEPATITPDNQYTTNLSSSWPLTVRQENDGNAATENNADRCSVNP